MITHYGKFGGYITAKSLGNSQFLIIFKGEPDTEESDIQMELERGEVCLTLSKSQFLHLANEVGLHPLVPKRRSA